MNAQKMTPSLISALKECYEWSKLDSAYFWKPATMRKLHSFGLVMTRATSLGVCYVITHRGTDYLESLNK